MNLFYTISTYSSLFFFSLLFFIIPTCLNLIMAISLIAYKNFYNDQFHNWFKLNSAIASIFTILSATNIELLNILSSKFAKLNIFSAIYSMKTQRLLFWLSILNFIIEDALQFIIQVNDYFIIYNVGIK